MPAHVQLRFIDIIMSSAPLHGVTYLPFPLRQNPLSIPSNKSSLKTFLFPKPPCFPFRVVVFVRMKSLLAARLRSLLAARLKSLLAARLRSLLAARFKSLLAARLKSLLAARFKSLLAARLWSLLAARLWSLLAARLRSLLAARLKSLLAARLKFLGKLQALVYDILPSTTALFSYAIGSINLSAIEQFFVGAQTVVSLLQTTQIKQGVSFIAANKVYTSTNKTTII